MDKVITTNYTKYSFIKLQIIITSFKSHIKDQNAFDFYLITLNIWWSFNWIMENTSSILRWVSIETYYNIPVLSYPAVNSSSSKRTFCLLYTQDFLRLKFRVFLVWSELSALHKINNN